MTTDHNDGGEVRLGLRDILTICGIGLTIVMSMWALTSDLKVSVAQIGERLQSLDGRLRAVETLTSPQVPHWPDRRPVQPAGE